MACTLARWRDHGGGPKLGVISNFDERLEPLLQSLVQQHPHLCPSLKHCPSLPNYSPTYPHEPNTWKDIAQYFDEGLILDSYTHRSEKPDIGMFELAADKADASPDKCFHVGDRVSKDVAGAARADWTALHLNERCDNDLPDWDAFDSEELAAEGQQARQKLLHWGRRDMTTGLQWYELWGLRDILTLFGYDNDDDDDHNKVIRTTQRKGRLHY